MTVVELTPNEARALGALIEKHMTTPDHYPLTTSALVAACNQTSSRNPVMSLGESAVVEAVDGLRAKELARTVKRSGERSLKHLEIADDGLEISRGQKALLAVLLLRGPQTSGELRQRTERYIDLGGLDVLESVLEEMASMDNPVATLLERVPGQKERRWMHLLGDGAVVSDTDQPDPVTDSGVELGPSRLEVLESQVAALTERVATLELLLE